MALADVGGFHDGIKLILSIFLAPIAATFFENDLLNGNLYEETSNRIQNYQQRKLAQSLYGPTGFAILSVKSNMQILINSIKTLKLVKLSLTDSILDCLCQAIRRQRR